MFMMKSGGLPSVVSDDDVQSIDQKICGSCTSQFQNFHVNFYKFYALFFTRLSQLGLAITSFV
jgi:hypothetical protein